MYIRQRSISVDVFHVEAAQIGGPLRILGLDILRDGTAAWCMLSVKRLVARLSSSLCVEFVVVLNGREVFQIEEKTGSVNRLPCLHDVPPLFQILSHVAIFNLDVA